MDIKVACHSVIKKGNKILLGLRNKPASESHGKYYTVGGGLEFMEKREDGLKREVREEANIQIKNIKLFKIYENIRPNYTLCPHGILFVYTAIYDSGELKGGDDCMDPQFYSIEEIKQFIAEDKVGRFAKQILEDMGEI
ncbi:MAG: NUDIX hydrolase [Alphaproteobacteria bacterium]|nr:NUDIX hydrolase [Alphaproteobacteria bacterium]